MNYAYDPIGRRISVTEDGQERDYLWDGNSLIATYVSGSMENLYAVGSGIDEVLGVYGDQTQYLHSNHLGSITGITGTDGSVLGARSYTPYGMVRSTTGTFNSKLGFIGRSQSSTTGLTYIRARYYDASVGRFNRIDPIQDGLNWYGYAGGNPIRYYDPYGLDIIVLNDSDAVGLIGGPYGHNAILVGEEGNWNYYSKDGPGFLLGGKEIGDSGHFRTTNGNARIPYKTFKRFNEDEDISARYNTRVRFETNCEETDKARQKAEEIFDRKYNFFDENCADLVEQVAHAAGVDLSNSDISVFGVKATIPNIQIFGASLEKLVRDALRN
ncbi:RHS repeat-associated core domain-containing protein [Orenia marismortui]|uniref:RHS repeat-associated protein n=1 Tax=Orenia marismortui TaxID=46469 RepID=A0A4R8GXX0_9FIRM|nr:RHS repeat-associated core domain-containing protein [Orenia marismortui]TDX51145.1 RHS repeat-associated protein [Orenia marismortui]